MDERLLITALISAGLMLNSALYLTAVFVAGLWVRDAFAWKMAIVTIGVVYLSYFVQSIPKKSYLVAVFFVALTIVLGALAGLHLVFIGG